MATRTGSKGGQRISDDAVKGKAGKTWSQWFLFLDKAGAKKMQHKEIASHLDERHGIAG